MAAFLPRTEVVAIADGGVVEILSRQVKTIIGSKEVLGSEGLFYIFIVEAFILGLDL